VYNRGNKNLNIRRKGFLRMKKKINIKAGVAVMALVAGSVIFPGVVGAADPVKGVDYDDASTQVQVNVGSQITVATSGDLTFNATLGSTASSVQTVTVTTNNATGYNLKFSSTTTSTDLVCDVSPCVAATDKIPSIGHPFASPAALDAGTWGYLSSTSFTAATTFRRIPSFNTPDTIVTATERTGTTGTPTYVTFGVWATSAMKSGAYKANVIYTATVNS
jgi:hypothetical protein